MSQHPDAVRELVDRLRAEQMTRPGEPFNAPSRVARLTDLMAQAATMLDPDDPECFCFRFSGGHRMSDHAHLVKAGTWRGIVKM